MCFFPLSNYKVNSLAYRKGVTEFDCGSCPECLRKRSNVWALRAVYEAKSHSSNLMITLTYDNFIRDEKTGRIIGETPVNPNLVCNKRDVQLFIKRLRKWYSGISSEKIKYLAAAEYGSRTHRAHYHLILFGVKFPDFRFYKKSRRGNVIYTSNILTRLWKHGICTIDSINVNSAIARYCTKYCAKSRSDQTFMLFSHHIGLFNLLKAFNGKSYFIDGREYPIPRSVWQEVIMNRYSDICPDMDYKYVNPSEDSYLDGSFDRNVVARSLYRAVRDSDLQYNQYLDYWRSRGESYSLLRPSVSQRIYLLDDTKYHNYKCAALNALYYRSKGIPVPAPGSNCVSAWYRWRERVYGNLNLVTCPPPSRPNRASDTDIQRFKSRFERIFEKSPWDRKFVQISFDFNDIF